MTDDEKKTLAILKMDPNEDHRSCTWCVNTDTYIPFHYLKKNIFKFWEKKQIVKEGAGCPFADDCGSRHRTSLEFGLCSGSRYFSGPDNYEIDLVKYYNQVLIKYE
jgi:hypothetical protein